MTDLVERRAFLLTLEFETMPNANEQTEAEVMARMACADHGYTFVALVSDVSDDKPVEGFTYVVPGQDVSAPNWVSIHKSCFRHWDGSSGR